MMLSECAKALHGDLIGEDVAVSSVCIDTRAIQPGQLYVAIKGENFDGNAFLAQAIQAGAAAAIVNQSGATNIGANVSYIVVDDTRLALAELAGAWRSRLAEIGQIGVVGITGSNGKTTVKEMVAAILSVNSNVLYTQGNLNNDIGVPLTLLRLNEQHRYAVIEMGANHPGEIAYTSRFAQADVAVITNAGPAHLEGFGNLEGVAKSKGEIYQALKQTGTAIINRDDAFFDYWKSVVGARKAITFGVHQDADVTAKNVKLQILSSENVEATVKSARFATRFELFTANGSIEINLRLAGRHNVINALAAAASAIALNIELDQIKQGLECLQPVKGRLQPLIGQRGNIVIDDTYKANAASLEAGLDVLINCPGQPWLILGAFGEQGPDSAKIHQDLGVLIKAKGIERLMAVGADARNTVQAFGQNGLFFATQNELIEALKNELTGGEAILIKGSRAQRMENVVAMLLETTGT
jgi:UDP-N-acetylmuramoyl-tripeptide--D-alanyl-D-alanine ligase